MQATAFRVSSTAFVGQVLSIDRAPARTNELLQVESHIEFLRLNRLVTDTVFLEVLTEGKLSLYRYQDEKVHYFARKAGGEWQELPLYQYILKRNGLRTMVQMEAYKDQLALLLADCPEVAKSARSTAFSEAALLKITRVYNGCMGEKTAPVAERATRGRFGITAGISGTTMHIRKGTEEAQISRSWMPTREFTWSCPCKGSCRTGVITAKWLIKGTGLRTAGSQWI